MNTRERNVPAQTSEGLAVAYAELTGGLAQPCTYEGWRAAAIFATSDVLAELALNEMVQHVTLATYVGNMAGKSKTLPDVRMSDGPYYGLPTTDFSDYMAFADFAGISTAELEEIAELPPELPDVYFPPNGLYR